MLLGVCPAVEVQESFVRIGGKIVPWDTIRRVDRTGWLSPLVARLTMFDDSRVTIVYPGDLDACKSLLRTLRRMSRDALIDGVPYRQYWGELAGYRPPAPPRHYRLLLPEDEAEVERLYQKLKTEKHLDPNER